MSAGEAPDDLPGIERAGASLSPGGRRSWSWRLTAYLRALAAVQLAKGLFHWATLIGVGTAGEPFAGRTLSWQVSTVFFAVVDLVAAVGLWLGAAWGVVIWLLAAVGQIAVGSFLIDAFGRQWVLAALELVAMAAYVALSVKARREQENAPGA